MRLDSRDLVEESYNQGDYKDLTLSEYREVVTHPWKYLKEEMRSDDLNSIRMKYFGVFKVHLGRAKGVLHTIKKNLEEEKMNEDKGNKLVNRLEKYIG